MIYIIVFLKVPPVRDNSFHFSVSVKILRFCSQLPTNFLRFYISASDVNDFLSMSGIKLIFIWEPEFFFVNLKWLKSLRHALWGVGSKT